MTLVSGVAKISGRVRDRAPVRLLRTNGMRLRFKAFGLHLMCSICLLGLVLGALYFGWYRWPGWYLTGVAQVALVLVLVDAALGPLLTFIIANPTKQRGELTRDVAIIVAVQLIGLAYGSFTLWQGRPLYYTFSVDRLEMVQASDINTKATDLARKLNPQLAPAWYRTPRWVWAPLPDDPGEAQKIVTGTLFGGDDVVDMPRYFRSWEQGSAELRKRLKPVDQIPMFSKGQRARLKAKISALRLPSDLPNAMLLTGRGRLLLVVFETHTLAPSAILSAD